MVSYAVTGQANELLIQDKNSNTISILLKGTEYDTGIAIPDEKWHHWAFSWRSSDGELKVYLDGVEAFSGTAAQGESLISGGSLILGQEQDSVGGGFDSSQTYQGQIDDFRIWNTVRTQQEIQDNYQNTLTGTETGLVAYLDFNNVTGNTATDVTGNGNDGIINGATVVDNPILGSRTNLNVGDTFTQADIDNNLLIYEPNASTGVQDSFKFTVTDGETTTEEQTFNIGHPVDLSNWKQEGLLDNGNWEVTGEQNQFVTQSVNGDPTFFVSPFNFINGTVDGTIQVNTSGDDDYIGFVFGYQSPVTDSGDATNDYEFLLFDWKQSNQNPSLEGYTLSRLTSPVSPDFWGHTPSEDFEVITTDYSTSKGWNDFQEYDFSLTYTTDRILIKIDNETIFDVEGEFDPGRFGFYNYSQEAVKYGNFRATGLSSDIPIATPDVYNATEDTPLTIPTASGLLKNDISLNLATLSIYQPELITDTLNGTIDINEDGSFTYTPSENFAGEDSFSYRAFDGNNFSALATVTLNVENADNDAPTELTLSNITITELTANDTAIATLTVKDPDPNDTHTYTLLDNAEERFKIVGDELQIADETLITPGEYSLTVEVTDAGGESIQRTFTITVNETNFTPTDITLSNTTIAENSENNTVIGILSTTDSDAEDTHTYSLINSAGGRFALNGNELVVADSTRLDYDTTSSHTITVRTTDQDGSFYDESFDITLTNIVEPGFISFAQSNYTVNEDTGTIHVTLTRTGGSEGEVSVTINLTDDTATAPDDYTSDPITVTFANGETSKTVSIPIVDDGIFEATETVNLTLTNPTGGATLGTQDTATLNIIDNDAVPGILNFAEASYQVDEDGTSVTVTVNRTDGSDGDVSATVLLSDGTATGGDDYLANPVAVDFASGETSKTVTIPLIDDSVLESDETINLTLANPTGGVTIGEQNNSVITIKDNDFRPTLTVDIAQVSVSEADGTVTATITRNTPTDEALEVNLASSDTSELTTPATVTIPVGESSVTVDLTIVDDENIDSNPNVTLIATAPGFISGGDGVRVINNDTVNLTLELESNNLTEGTTKTITITQDITTNEPLVVELSSNSSEIILPETVTIPANQAGVTFEIEAIDNNNLEGDRSVTITAKPTTSDTSTVLETGQATATVNIIDDESPSLTVTSDRDLIAEIGTATVTITRNTDDTTNPLTVNLASSDTNEATVPDTITIPAGESSVTAIATGVNDNVSDGNKPVTITATVSGFNTGETTVDVTDIDVPDLVITQFSDFTAFTDSQTQFNYTVENLGLANVNGTLVDRIYLSEDNQLDDDDELLTEFEISANIQVNQFYDRNVSYFNPRTPGTYYLIATTDADNQIDEGTGIGENNNTVITPFEVVPAYYAEVSTDIEVGVAGQDIILEGIARSNEDNSPISFEFVTIEIENNGFTRELSGFTDADGNFVRQFTPLLGEGGDYNIKAFFPDNPEEDTEYEDSFQILAARFTTESVSHQVIADTPFSNTVSLENLTDTPLTEFTAEVEGAPENWDIQVNVPDTLALDSASEVIYTISAPNESLITEDTFKIKLTSSEGVTAELPVTVNLERIVPRLVATVGETSLDSNSPLQSGMLRGEQTAVEVTISNEGGATAENIDVLLPDAPWLSLASTDTIESLAPEESTNVTLLLTPEADLDLNVYRGNIIFDAAGNDGDLSLPFEFRALSEAVGNLQVNVIDELFYFAEGAPKLEDANVILRDYFTGEEIARLTTDETGIVNFEDLPEGYYNLEVRADDHETFRQTIEIDAGENEVIESFLSRQTVKYIWTVTPTEIEDEYHIQVESVFETNVPIPTIVVEPGSIDLGDLQVKGQVKQVDMTLTNHGLIGADDVKLLFNEEPNLHLDLPPEYKIEPLIESIDRLEAKSSITVPVRITRIADDSPESPCNLTGSVEWSYLAGSSRVGKSTPIAINNVEFGDCGHPPGPPPPGGGGGGGGGRPIIIEPGEPGEPGDPDPDFSVQVRIQIEQTAIMTRSAFLGELSIENSSDTIPLEDIAVNLEVLDEDGDVVNELFGITDPVLENITSVDGSGTLATNSTGNAEWTFIPTNLAAPETPEEYSIGGTLSYDQDGEFITVPLVSTPVTVFPQAELYVDYFHQRNVYGDDPFTDATEVSEPFSLGVLVHNQGFGAANNLSITSAQPKIIENEHGLLIDFDILGSQVNGNQASPSLTADFGNIAAGETAVADWILKSTLQGKFIEYDATFEHVNSLGNPELSLIKEVDIHELVQKVQADDDGLSDFLVNDELDDNFYPDILYFSDGTTAPVTPIDEVTVDAPVDIFDLEAQLTLSPPYEGGLGGISYITLDDPADGQFEIEKIIRSDDTEINPENIWRTDRTFPATGRPIYENKLHFLDKDSTGSYTIIYDSNDSAPPQVREIIDVEPNPRNIPVNNLQVVFTEPIRANTFDAQDITLTLDDGSNLITNGVSVTQIDPITFQINNLTGITGNIGQYQLSVDATGIEDLSGNAGAGTVNENWVFTGDRPAVAEITGFDRNLPNSVVDTFDVTFTEEIVPDSFDYQDITLTRNEGGNLLNDTVTITQLDNLTYRVSNLANFTNVEGDYELLVTANNIKDTDDNNGVGGKGFTWVLDTNIPTLTNIDDVTSPRNTPINSLEVTFDQAINPETFTKEDLTLTLNQEGATLEEGASLVPLLSDDVTVEKRNETTYIIKGLNSLQTEDGEYTLTVNGAAIEDNAGNATDNSLSSTWELDTDEPPLAINIQVTAAGISTSELSTSSTFATASEPGQYRVNSQNFAISGNLSEENLQVYLQDTTTGESLGQATVEGTNFTADVELSGAGSRTIELTVVDEAGNQASDTINVFSDVTQPAILEILNVPETSTLEPVNYIDVVFSEVIAIDSFSYQDITLTRDGGENLITDGVTIEHLQDTTYRINNLTDLTQTPGTYQLNLNGTTVEDLAGNSGLSDETVSFSIAEPATPEVIINQTQGSTTVTEGGAEDSYTLVLATQPTANVTIDLTVGEPISTDKTSITFTPDNWDVPQNIIITANNDTVTEGEHNSVISHSITSDDLDYNTLTLPDLNVSINDDDAEIYGQSWNDLNGDGVKDDAEPKLANWTVYLDANSNGELDEDEPSTTTDENGNYSFTNLRPDTYNVSQVVQDGWQQTYPAIEISTTASSIELHTPSEPDTITPSSITTTAGELINLDDFGNDSRFTDINGQGFTSVIIDTGIDLDHPFFGADANGDNIADRIVYQYDFADNDNDARDVDGHGSHVASIIGSEDSTYTGIAPEADLIALKVFKDNGSGFFADLEESLQWVYENAETYNIASVNLSLGDEQNWDNSTGRYGIDDELAALASIGVIVTAAAGNNYTGIPGVAYPAADLNSIAVGAVDSETDQIPGFSQRHGTLTDVFAPGIPIIGADPEGGTQSLGGTSQAAPHIAGIAVLAQQIAVEELGRKLTVAEFDSLLATTGVIINDGDDEVDEVANTGLDFSRVDVLALGEEILTLDSEVSTPDSQTPDDDSTDAPLYLPVDSLTDSHTVTLAAGEVVNDLDFGNQLIDDNTEETSISITDSSGNPDDASIQFTTPLSQFRDGVADSDLVRPSYPDTQQYIDITNTGEGSLSISEIRINASGVTAEIPTEDILLNPNETQRIQLTYTPSEPSENFTVEEGLTIISNAANTPEMSVALSGKSTFDGDINYDGLVSFGDLGPLNSNWGRENTDANWDETADINGDGLVSFGDLGPLNQQWNEELTSI